MKDNILKKIGDIIIVNVTPKIKGRVNITEYSDSWVGLTEERNINKEFRVSYNGVLWTDWKELNNSNLSEEKYDSDGQMIIQLRFTRIGSDNTGEIEFKNILFYGKREEIEFIAPTLYSSIFSSIIGTDELRILEENLFKKLYYRGILPDYIIRAENSDYNEDSDFVDVFYSIARFFAIMIRFYARFENFITDYEIMRENVRQYGIYFDESNITLEELQYLSQHLFDEIRKRGTAMIFKRKGEIVNGIQLPIDGELIRLTRNKNSDELLYENIPLNQVGWCLGQSSPLYRGTCQSLLLNKTSENSKDFISIDDFVISGSINTNSSIETFDGKKVLCLLQSNDYTSIVGLGRTGDENVFIDNLIVVDSRLDYEITFAVNISENYSDENKLLFGVEGFDIYGNKLNDAFVTPNGNKVSETFFLEKLSKFKKNNWYYIRGIIHCYSSCNVNNSPTNVGFGNNLYFNNSFVKYILPKIQAQGVSGFNVKIWDYKIRPLVRGTNILPLKNGIENSHSLGFVQSQRIFYMYIRNNNNSQSKDEITNIIQKYLLPYDTADMFVFMSNY